MSGFFSEIMLGITAAPKAPLPDYQEFAGPVQAPRFSPYNDNGGTTAAVCGEDFALVASDTRLTDGGYGILSRTQPRLFTLTDEMCLAATGCWADVVTLTKQMKARIQMFKYTHNAKMRTKEGAQMLSNMLYAKRFFPYSVTNILVSASKLMPTVPKVKSFFNEFLFS